MVNAAKTLYEADSKDQRAVSDYGIAILRMAIVIPAARKQDKLAALQQAHELLTRAFQQNSKSAVNGLYKAWDEEELGDFYRANGDRAAALRSYQMAIDTTEASMGADPDGGSRRRLVSAARKMAEEYAHQSQRAEALAALDRALQIGRAVDTTPGGKISLRILVPRAWQSGGSVYALLASRSADKTAGDRDRESARGWYRRAVDEWRKLETTTGFISAYRKELESAMTELALLEKTQAGTRRAQ